MPAPFGMSPPIKPLRVRFSWRPRECLAEVVPLLPALHGREETRSGVGQSADRQRDRLREGASASAVCLLVSTTTFSLDSLRDAPCDRSPERGERLGAPSVLSVESADDSRRVPLSWPGEWRVGVSFSLLSPMGDLRSLIGVSYLACPPVPPVKDSCVDLRGMDCEMGLDLPLSTAATLVAMSSNSMRLVLPMGDDMHTHLRQGELMDAVVPHLRKGGCNRALVMPNTVPPIVTCSQALEYRNELLKRDPNVNYMMTLYLCPDVDPDDLAKNAKSSHVFGVKLYPRGVTTNSEAGVEDLAAFDGVFEVLQRCGLSLHVHAEAPRAPALEAEEMFLPVFEQIHMRFPDLKIVFEHISTAAAIEAVKGKQNIAATITAHHLLLTTADVLAPEEGGKPLEKGSSAGAAERRVLNPHNFCKPIAKCEEDRRALLNVIREGNPQFFLGSDSAPHPVTKKASDPPAAGVFTQPFLLAYLADIFARAGCLDKLRGFACENAAAFFGIPKKELIEGADCVVLERTPFSVPKVVCGVEGSGSEVVPFLAGSELCFTASVVPFSAALETGQ
ncbi:dihydroorotase protein, putative [Eimeria brunetti]|uniref:Dihydroorotase protein, putative n=1 Tax=Eimeria brunetti TaxID=51314 RepID=U6LN65_9EIME|nr:dihydroorotase protein, putative [Eimeria brunetti]